MEFPKAPPHKNIKTLVERAQACLLQIDSKLSLKHAQLYIFGSYFKMMATNIQGLLIFFFWDLLVAPEPTLVGFLYLGSTIVPCK